MNRFTWSPGDVKLDPMPIKPGRSETKKEYIRRAAGLPRFRGLPKAVKAEIARNSWDHYRKALP
jgi:hypothetical protein